MSAAIDRLVKSGVYVARLPHAAWRSDIMAIRTVDALAEKRANGWGQTAIMAAAAAVLCLAFVAADDRLIVQVAVAGFVVLVALAIGSLSMRSKAKELDFENRRYVLADELVELLASDVDA